jgi:predicted Zn-dependent peptidase
MSSRLFQEVRERRGLVYSIYSYASPYSDSGVFGVYAGTGPEQVEELVPVVCDEICRVAEDASDEEVARARAQLKASLLMSLESTMARCEQLGQQMLIHGRPIGVPELLSKVDAVDAPTVRRVAAVLRTRPPVVTALGPLAGLESYDRIAARLA